jgi:hypothetical protein
MALFTVVWTGCAYNWGNDQRDLPGRYTEVALPMFRNRTNVVGIEPKFTNYLVREFARSNAVKIVDKQAAPVFVDGELKSLQVIHEGQIDANSSENAIMLPDNTVLTTEYRLIMTAHIKLVRSSDLKVLWSGEFKNERTYNAPQVGLPGINSVNPLYNHTARLEVIDLIAQDMMTEAHDRMTENF